MYHEQLHAVPEGWRYERTSPAFASDSVATKKITALSGRTGAARERAEQLALRVLPRFGYVHVTRAHASASANLIHSAERLIWRSPLPYVVDLEHVDLFVIYQSAAYSAPWTMPILERLLLDDRLRFLLPWSETARRSVLHRVSERARDPLDEKMKTVYPAVRPMVETPKPRTKGPLRVLFVGTKFYDKGGVEALAAVRAARDAGHDIELDAVTYAPAELRAASAADPAIRFHTPGGQEVVRRLYTRAHVLLFPSHMDTYGIVVGEAMSYGLPVLAPNHLALAEIIEDGCSGLLFPPENMLLRADTTYAFTRTLPPPASYLEALRAPSTRYVRGIVSALGRLAQDEDLRLRLAHGALATVTEGLLSMTRRRSRLADIYVAACAGDAAGNVK